MEREIEEIHWLLRTIFRLCAGFVAEETWASAVWAGGSSVSLWLDFRFGVLGTSGPLLPSSHHFLDDDQLSVACLFPSYWSYKLTNWKWAQCHEVSLCGWAFRLECGRSAPFPEAEGSTPGALYRWPLQETCNVSFDSAFLSECLQMFEWFFKGPSIGWWGNPIEGSFHKRQRLFGPLLGP